jgi:phenylacetate-CoA ligase
LIDKHVVQADIEKFTSKKHYNVLCNVGKTSGSTGTPGKFIRDFDSINFEHACVWRNWKNGGDDGKKRLTLRGDVIVPSSQDEPPFWRYNPANLELQMSSYHLSKRNSIHYVQKVLEFQPKVLFAGPSMAHLLARFFRLHNVPYQFDAIFTSSESLDLEVRHYMEEVFQCRVYDWYGQAERVAAIGQCKSGNYHIQEDYSIVELLAGNEEGSYELVGSHLHNYVMPLLRYRTQDFVYLKPDTPEYEQCDCGCCFRSLDRILGRSYGYLLTPEGYHIAITAQIPIGVDNVIETQFYQERPGEVVLKVLSNGRFCAVDRERLIQNTLKYTSPQMQVIVEEVDAIPRGPNGKFINVINKMPISLN